MSSKQWLRIPWWRRARLKSTWNRDRRSNSRKNGEAVPLLFRLSGKRLQGRRWLSAERADDPFSAMTRLLSAFPGPAESHPPHQPYPRSPGTHTKRALCSPNTFHLSVSPLTQSKNINSVCLCFVLFAPFRRLSYFSGRDTVEGWQVGDSERVGWGGLVCRSGRTCLLDCEVACKKVHSCLAVS